MTTFTEQTQGFQYDPFDIEVMRNPLRYYTELREKHPYYYLPQYDAYALSRFDDVIEFLGTGGNSFVPSERTVPGQEVLLNTHRGEVHEASVHPLEVSTQHGSPLYETLRHATLKPFRPGAVGKLAERVREIAQERLDVLIPRRRFDLTQHYAGITSAGVTCELFRLPMSEAKYVLDTVNAGSLTDPETGKMVGHRSGNTRMFDLVAGVVRARRAEGPDGSWDLGDHLFDLEVDGRRLSDAELVNVLAVPFVGGTETVPKVVSHGLWELSKRPEQWAAVAADPDAHARTAFREMVRLYAPAQWFLRTVHQPTTIGALDLQVGQRVLYVTPAAARDPREYGADAEEFRWDRANERLINFGHGQHFCLGYHLAMLEGSILVAEFLKRVRSFTVDEEHAVRLPSSFQWGWNELPITIDETID